MKTNHTPVGTIDEYGVLKAQIADLLVQKELLETRLGDLPAGAHEGNYYRLAIVESIRETPDGLLKAKIKELVAEHLSRQYVCSHTNETKVRTHKVSARTGKVAVAA